MRNYTLSWLDTLPTMRESEWNMVYYNNQLKVDSMDEDDLELLRKTHTVNNLRAVECDIPEGESPAANYVCVMFHQRGQLGRYMWIPADEFIGIVDKMRKAQPNQHNQLTTVIAHTLVRFPRVSRQYMLQAIARYLDDPATTDEDTAIIAMYYSKYPRTNAYPGNVRKAYRGQVYESTLITESDFRSHYHDDPVLIELFDHIDWNKRDSERTLDVITDANGVRHLFDL